MEQKSKIIGYVACEFDESNKKALIAWVNKHINENNLTYASVSGKIMGGNVAEDLHLTLIYGLATDLVYEEKITEYLNKITLGKVLIKGLGIFKLTELQAKVLYLDIDDGEGIVEKISDELAKFPVGDYANQFKFKPHVTIAYVKDSFDAEALEYAGPKTLRIAKIVYKKHITNVVFP